MKRMTLSIRILMVPLLLALLLGAAGCLIVPWGWGDHGGERGNHRGSDGGEHHGPEGGDHHHD